MPAFDEILDRWRREVRARVPEADEEFAEELAQHVAEHWLRTRNAGAALHEADAAALAELAGWRAIAPPNRLAPAGPRWRGTLAGVTLDLRHAARILVARPVVTAGAVLLMAIGIGATSPCSPSPRFALASFAVSGGDSLAVSGRSSEANRRGPLRLFHAPILTRFSAQARFRRHRDLDGPVPSSGST